MKNSTISLADNTQIVRYQWLIETPQAHIILVHGYAEHAGRYDHFAKFLNNRGINLTSFDLRGHGKSEGTRAYVSRFENYIEDLQQVITSLDIKGPIFMMGHSLGGLVAVHFALSKSDANIKGLISSSAALEIDKDLSPILQALAPILGFLFPKLKTEKLDTTYLTRDPEVLENYMNDPLMYLDGTRARTGAEMLKAIKKAREGFNSIKLPLLVLHGDADRLTMPGGSQKLYDDAISSDKSIKLYPGLYHELLNEPEQEMIMADIADWVLERV